ncbi:indole-3-glycerol phosphate synthase TrpC [Flavobacteriaceae bacterium]|nr:indole-3-glycerol phosphate synthase TrpC [Flavobacteriaceae bacterium]MDA9029922.1 indole-3-glycerol phosphate synthase TrpC [Flavobacteriaceae bacterium]
MSSILDRIVTDKYTEVALRKQLIPIKQLEHSVLFEHQSPSLSTRLINSTSGLITEHKRRSPSKDCINQNLNVQDVAKGYETAGACGMSVLTDMKYFGGSLEDLLNSKASCEIPLLRKEFIIDTYQIVEAKAYGADVILLIAAILSREEIQAFSRLAQSLGMEVLLEIHNEDELQKSIMPSLNMIGVNNRNLKTFEVSLETSKTLSGLIPDEFVKISESGIRTVEDIKSLQPYGFKGFLIGENFMKTENPGASAAAFIKQLNG